MFCTRDVERTKHAFGDARYSHCCCIMSSSNKKFLATALRLCKAIDFTKFTSTDAEFERVFRTSLSVAKKRGYTELELGMYGLRPIDRKVARWLTELADFYCTIDLHKQSGLDGDKLIAKLRELNQTFAIPGWRDATRRTCSGGAQVLHEFTNSALPMPDA